MSENGLIQFQCSVYKTNDISLKLLKFVYFYRLADKYELYEFIFCISQTFFKQRILLSSFHTHTPQLQNL